MVTRELQDELLRLNEKWQVISVTGPRQSGKTTLCKMAFPNYAYVNFEHIPTRDKVLQDIDGFLDQYKDGLIIDEAQHIPSIGAVLKMIVDNLKPKAITTGDNHFFGNNRTGSADYIELMKNDYGYEYFRVDSIKFENNVISSTNIRNALQSGDINTANLLLGYRFYIKGDVVQGKHLGRTIGFRTANLKYPENLVKIPDGVYAVEVEINDKKFMGIANYGTNPTVTNDTNEIEDSGETDNDIGNNEDEENNVKEKLVV